MALVKITTNDTAFRDHDPERIAEALGELTYSAEGVSSRNRTTTSKSPRCATR